LVIKSTTTNKENIMNTQPDTHTIDATEAQVAYLNRLAEISAQYRTNLKWLKQWAETALNTPNVDNVDHQTLAKVQQLNGAVGEMLQMKHFIFPNADLPEEASERRERIAKQNGWIKLAREENPNGMMGLNWFVAAPIKH
jgi:hypothetical protein